MHFCHSGGTRPPYEGHYEGATYTVEAARIVDGFLLNDKVECTVGCSATCTVVLWPIGDAAK